jgi:hypothetical protein
MTDERNENVQPGVYDDDRLLACALGLEDDPGLLATAATDTALAARLAAMRADVAHIGAQVSAAVPEPGESYTDLSGERWTGLTEFFEPPAATTTPRRRRRWWQVVAPVAAILVVALVVGIVAVQNGAQMNATSDSGSAEVARSSDGAGGAAFGESVTKTQGTDQTTTSAPATLRERFADQLDRFAVVVLARAREVSGAVQKFAVLRIFKGQAPKVVELAVGDEPADRGRLHLLMLDPTTQPEVTEDASASTESPWPLTESPLPVTESPWPETVSPEPIPSLAAAEGPGEPLAVSYMYEGEPTMVREFPAGTDPGAVSLSIP